jgi:hypothetical protein
VNAATTSNGVQRPSPLESLENNDQRDESTGRFITGNNGGGRKVGSRNKLSQQFFDDLYAVWQELGPQALRQMAADNPKDFVKVAAMVVPKEVDIDVTGQVGLFAKIQDFHEAYQLALKHIGAAPLLEGETIE